MSTTQTAFDRATVRGQIEESTGHGLSVEDALPDTLIAAAEAFGLTPVQLRMWIFDTPHLWTVKALGDWSTRYLFAEFVEEVGVISNEHPRCGHCAEQVGDPESHVCPVARVRAISIYIDLPAILPERRAAVMARVTELMNAIAEAAR